MRPPWDEDDDDDNPWEIEFPLITTGHNNRNQ